MNTSPDKIGLYQPYPHTMGGLQAVVLQLGKGLKEQGWNPLIICPEDGTFAGVARKADLPVLVSDPGAAWHIYGRGDRTTSYLFSPRRAWQLVRYWIKLGRQLRRDRRHPVTLQRLSCRDARRARWAPGRNSRCLARARLYSVVVVNFAASLVVTPPLPYSRGMLDYFSSSAFLARRFRVIHNGLEAFAGAHITLRD